MLPSPEVSAKRLNATLLFGSVIGDHVVEMWPTMRETLALKLGDACMCLLRISPAIVLVVSVHTLLDHLLCMRWSKRSTVAGIQTAAAG